MLKGITQRAAYELNGGIHGTHSSRITPVAAIVAMLKAVLQLCCFDGAEDVEGQLQGRRLFLFT